MEPGLGCGVPRPSLGLGPALPLAARHLPHQPALELAPSPPAEPGGYSLDGQVWKPQARSAPQGSSAAARGARGEGLAHTLLAAQPGVTLALPFCLAGEVASQMGEALAPPGRRMSCSLARFMVAWAILFHRPTVSQGTCASSGHWGQ